MIRLLVSSVFSITSLILTIISVIAGVLTVVLGITALFVAIGLVIYYVFVGSQPDMHINTSHSDMYVAMFSTIALPFFSVAIYFVSAKLADAFNRVVRRIQDGGK
jgi:pilus assembly protein TadC